MTKDQIQQIENVLNSTLFFNAHPWYRFKHNDAGIDSQLYYDINVHSRNIAPYFKNDGNTTREVYSLFDHDIKNLMTVAQILDWMNEHE